MQHVFPYTFQVNLPGVQPSSIETCVLQAATLQNQLSQVSFLGIFRATAPPHNFLVAAFLLFVKNLFEVKRKKTWALWDINVCSWIASEFSSCLHCYIMFWICPAISHVTFQMSLEALYDNWLLLNLLKELRILTENYKTHPSF